MKTIRHLACTVLTLLTLHAAPARAQGDTTPPEVQTLTFTPGGGDITNGPVAVTVTVRLTDASSGLNNATVRFESPSGGQGRSVILSSFTRVSGTAQDGTYQNFLEIPRYAETGEWRIAYITVLDVAGNSTFYFRPGTGASTYPAAIDVPLTITGTSDLAPPVVESLTFTPSGGDITNAPLTVTVTARVTDAVSGLDNAIAHFRSPTTGQEASVTLNGSSRTAGTAQDGTYVNTFQVPQFAETGEWRIARITTADGAGNSAFYSRPGNGTPAYAAAIDVPLTITGGADTAPPVVESLTFTPTQVEVSAAGQNVTVTARITDAPLGLANATVRFESPSGSQSRQVILSEFVRIAGTAQDGTYQTFFQMPQGAEAGEWRIVYITTRDAGGNSTFYFRPGTNASTYAAAIDVPLQVSTNIAPGVADTGVTGLTASGATVNGTVNPRGLATTWRVQYGPTVIFGQEFPTSAIGSGTESVAVAQPFTGLVPGTTVYYRFAATNGNGTNYSATNSFTVPTATPVDPVATTLFSKGDAVPGAGDVGGAPAGAEFTTFGVPSINDAGQVAFLGKWKSPSGSGVGLFAGNPAVLVVKKGDVAFGAATYKAFKDPVLNATGKIAFSATVAGTGITSENDTMLFTNAFAAGVPQALAMEGETADVADGSLIKSFTSYSLQGAEVLYTANLKEGTPVVTSANNKAAYSVTALGGTAMVVREAQPFGLTTVKSFKLLATSSGSAGQNRAHTEGNAAFLALLGDGTQALVDGNGGTLTPFAQTGQVTGGTALPLATWKSFGQVAAPDMTFAAVLATLTSGVGGVTSANAKGIFLGEGGAFEPVARVSGMTGIGVATFKAFKDPVLAPETGAIAFPATIKSAGVVTSADDATLWWQPAAGALTLLAREGDEPAETGTGVKWQVFKALAIAGGANGGPLFYATLLQGSGGVDATNDAGLWAVDSTGVLRLLVRKKDEIGGKMVKTITVLTAASGSPGTTHSFNNAGGVLYRATFIDGSQSLVLVQMP